MKRILFFSGIMILLCTALFLPGEILLHKSSRELDVVNTVSKGSYQSEDSALAREASAKLSGEEKLQLIRGEWESETSGAEDYEMQLRKYEAVQLARKKIAALHKEGKFPTDLSKLYQNWFGWQAEPYKAVDTTFHTYTAYYWRIRFERFDRDQAYTVCMLEDGTIFEPPA